MPPLRAKCSAFNVLTYFGSQPAVPAEEGLNISLCEYVTSRGSARKKAEEMARDIARFPKFACEPIGVPRLKTQADDRVAGSSSTGRRSFVVAGRPFVAVDPSYPVACNDPSASA